MFDDLIECSPTGKKKTKTGLTVFISTMFQMLLLGVMVLIPLIYTEALPKAMLTTFLVAPPPPPPPPPPAAAPVQRIVRPMAKLMQSGKLQAPTAIPKQVTMIKEEEMPPDMGAVGVVGGVPGGVPGGQAGGVLGGIIGGVVSTSLPPPPKVTPQRIRQGGNVQQARLINMVRPVYPPLARQARISGTVRLHAIIAKDGTVIQLEVVNGHPLLVQAALDAVRQWRYQPTLLNNEPVEVDTTVDVVFSLGG
ncbi:MAG: energy transducer TonB [Acidobacteria bacterium]|nr:energy transducer TonB [Acidobacteriota bacterium]MCL5288029.1 energy transducer TonB [Acidobacteriota bacterium]